MDELELRIAALETALIELTPWISTEAVDDAIRAISDVPATAGAEERTIRIAARDLLVDGRKRFEGMSLA